MRENFSQNTEENAILTCGNNGLVDQAPDGNDSAAAQGKNLSRVRLRRGRRITEGEEEKGTVEEGDDDGWSEKDTEITPTDEDRCGGEPEEEEKKDEDKNQ